MRKEICWIFVLVATVVLQIVFCASGNCQAWVSPKGTGSFSISYINNLDNTDYFGRGEQYIQIPPVVYPPNGYKLQNFGELRTQGVYFDFAYSFTDKFALTASIPYLAPKYTAPAGETNAFFSAHHFADGSIPLDDGHYHGSFQDFAFRVRYNVMAHPFLITPFAQYNQPSNGYLTYSHAIVGNGLHSVAFGSYIGGTLSGFLSKAYAQGNYALAFDQKFTTTDLAGNPVSVSKKRSLLEGEFGYFITPAIRAFSVLSAQISHGGLNGPDAFAPPIPQNPLFFNHTKLTRDNYLDIAFGGQYSLNNRVDLFGLVQHMITARNLHGLAYGLTFGMSWGFGGSPQRPCHC